MFNCANRSATLRLRAAGRPIVASAVRLPLEPAVAAVEARPRLAGGRARPWSRSRSSRTRSTADLACMKGTRWANSLRSAMRRSTTDPFFANPYTI